MPTTQNIISTLQALGATEKVVGFFAGLEYAGCIVPRIMGEVQVPGMPEPRPQRNRRNRFSKVAQAIIPLLEANLGGMTATKIAATVGGKPEAVQKTLQTMIPLKAAHKKGSRWFAGAATSAASADATGRRRRGRPAKTSSVSDSAQPSLSDATLQAIQYLPAGAKTEAVREYLLLIGITARSNHVGVALGRHARAGRLEKRGAGSDATWYLPTQQRLAG